MIYLDHNATTPIIPEVLEAMMPYLTTAWGNPSSTYRFGARLKGTISNAREQVAELIGASPTEIIFTSCATESNNTAIQAALKANPDKRHIVTSQVEHSSVLTCCKTMEREGYRVTYLPVDHEGLLSLTDLESAITDDTALVSLMWANNETGVLFPVEEIGERCMARGVPFHCDAVQAAGKLPVDTSNVNASYLSISGHKIGAPKGIGVLYVRDSAPYTSFIHGGHQEEGRRGGTENIAFVAGIGVAATIAQSRLMDYDRLVRPLRDAFESKLLNLISTAKINGNVQMRLVNTSNIRFPGIDNVAALTYLDQQGVCASSGSACMNSALTASHVITAMSRERKYAEESIRFSLCPDNTIDEINRVADILGNLSVLLG